MAKVQYYVLICDKKKKKKFTELLTDCGAVCVETVYGRGSAKSGLLGEALGFETEEHKILLSALMKTADAERLTEILCREHSFHGKNTGFAFSVAVEGLSL